MNKNCVSCGKGIIDRNIIGLNKKLIGKDVRNVYCMECLAAFFEVTVEELQEKIEQFKSEGCKLFS